MFPGLFIVFFTCFLWPILVGTRHTQRQTKMLINRVLLVIRPILFVHGVSTP